MNGKGLSPNDVVNAIGAENLILPAGTEKIGSTEYAVELNGSPISMQELNDLPLKQVNGHMIYIRDVAHVRDGFAVQQNIVRSDGIRASLLTIIKSGAASTLDIVARIKKAVPQVAKTLPAGVGNPHAAGPVVVRAGGRAVGDKGGGDSGVPDGDHDPGVPGQLAHDVCHRHFDPAGDPHVDHHVERLGRDDEHHDAGGIGAGGGHPGG